MSENFSDKMMALEKITQDIENSEISLEDAFVLFDKGMKLADECEKTLNGYKQKIEIIKKETDQRKEKSDENE